MTLFRALQPFASRPARCEVCGAPVSERHPHVVELARHTMRCACGACAILFRDGTGRFRTIPERVLEVAPLALTDEQWARLEIPVQLAFLIRRDEWVAVYPSPAGPIEAPVSSALEALLPRARTVEPEVEALLLHRSRTGEMACLIVPLDAAYELVGLVRRHWRGFTGGDEVQHSVGDFLLRLRAAARTVAP